MIDYSDLICSCDYYYLVNSAFRINHKLWIILYWVELFAIDKYQFVKGFYLMLINFCTWLFIISNDYDHVAPDLFYEDLSCELVQLSWIELQYITQQSLKGAKEAFDGV